MAPQRTQKSYTNCPAQNSLDQMVFNDHRNFLHPHHSAADKKSKTYEKKFAKQQQSERICRPVTVEESSDAEEDVEVAKAILPIASRSAGAKKAKQKKIMETLRKAATLLSGTGTLEGAENWLEKNGFNNETLEELRKNCDVISDLLKVKANSPNEARQLSGALANLGKFYIYRKGTKSIELLAPVAVFQGAKNYSTKKGFGFVRPTGSYFPAFYGISGWTEGLQATDKLLDPTLWTNEVMKFGSHHDFVFRSDGWDGVHENPIGQNHASHVENQLMLAWCYDVFTKATGSKPSRKKLHYLRATNIHKDADIALNDEPCSGCRSFQSELQLITGIQFTFIKLASLGDIVPRKNARGNKIWPTKVFTQSDEEEEEEEQLEILKESRRRLAVVIRGKPANKSSSSIPSQEKRKTASAHYTESMTISSSQTQQKVVRKKANKGSKKYCHYESDGSEWEYSPPTPPKSSSQVAHKPTARQTTTINGLLTPDLPPFGLDALERAERIRQKRRHPGDRETSPTLAKKNRLSKF